MNATVVDFAKDRVVYNFTNCTREELENKLNLFFTSEGYTPKSKEGETIAYTKGNRVLRLLLGAFVKYHRQLVVVKEDNNMFSVLLQKDSTDMSGGLIGMNQVKKEFARLAESFRTYFSS